MTTYDVKADPVPAATGPLSTAEIASILTRLDPAALQDAGAAHTQLGRELAAMAAHLAQEAGTLTQNWSGTAARAALTQVHRLHDQTATLATQAAQTGAVLTWLGTQVLPAFQHPATPAQARDHLTRLTTALIRADAALPTEIGAPTQAKAPSTTSTKRHIRNDSPINTTGSVHPASPVSSLQSATPAPAPDPPAATPTSSAPSPAPGASATTPVPGPMALANISPGTPVAPETPPGPATTAKQAAAATDTTSDALTTQAMPVMSAPATGNRTSRSRDRGGDREAQQPPAAAVPDAHAAASSPLPGLPGPPAAAPELSAGAPALSAHPLPELPTLDSGLSGGALPTPPVSGTALNSVGTLSATPAPSHSLLPPTTGAATPPVPERHRPSWPTEDRNPWGLPGDCVPPLIEGGGHWPGDPAEDPSRVFHG
jgi:hypothetical protein